MGSHAHPRRSALCLCRSRPGVYETTSRAVTHPQQRLRQAHPVEPLVSVHDPPGPARDGGRGTSEGPRWEDDAVSCAGVSARIQREPARASDVTEVAVPRPACATRRTSTSRAPSATPPAWLPPPQAGSACSRLSPHPSAGYSPPAACRCCLGNAPLQRWPPVGPQCRRRPIRYRED